MIEQELCSENEINEGEMKHFDVGPGKVLLTKHNGIISVLSAKCTHYGAPLHMGIYRNGKIRCPWHGACFDSVTGDIEDFPGLDSLHKYDIDIRDGKIFVKANEETFTNHKRVKPMPTYCNESEIFLIIGAGNAGIVCAETLRQNGFKGQIIMATQESHPPYDRPKLSKALNTEIEKLYLRNEEFLLNYSINIQYYKQAESLDTKEHCVKFADGTSQNYTKLFVATGGKPKKLGVPGRDLNGVYYLRSPEDAKEIHNASAGKDVVILGTSFIGLELASYLNHKAKSISIIGSGRSKVPLERVLGDKIGARYMKFHVDKGVKFFLDHAVTEIKGSSGKVTGVMLSDNTTIAADVVLAGIGVSPSTEFLKTADVKMDTVGHIIVDQFMCAGTDVYAGGDIVLYPYCYDNEQLVNIGHWQLAGAHGRTAALNMLGKESPCKTVPFFWTVQYGTSLKYAGHCTSYDEITYEGDVDEMKFIAYYWREGKMYAVAALNMGAKVSEIAFSIQEGSCPVATQSCCPNVRLPNVRKPISSNECSFL